MVLNENPKELAKQKIEELRDSVFYTPEYTAFINFLIQDLGRSDINMISADQIKYRLVESINNMQNVLSSISGSIASNQIVRTPAFLSYPGTGKTFGIKSVLSDLQEEGYIASFLYHDMMRYDPISAPFGVTIVSKGGQSKGTESGKGKSGKDKSGKGVDDNLHSISNIVEEFYMNLGGAHLVKSFVSKQSLIEFFGNNNFGNVSVFDALNHFSNIRLAYKKYVESGGEDSSILSQLDVNFSIVYSVYLFSKLLTILSLGISVVLASRAGVFSNKNHRDIVYKKINSEEYRKELRLLSLFTLFSLVVGLDAQNYDLVIYRLVMTLVINFLDNINLTLNGQHSDKLISQFLSLVNDISNAKGISDRFNGSIVFNRVDLKDGLFRISKDSYVVSKLDYIDLFLQIIRISLSNINADSSNKIIVDGILSEINDLSDLKTRELLNKFKDGDFVVALTGLKKGLTLEVPNVKVVEVEEDSYSNVVGTNTSLVELFVNLSNEMSSLYQISVTKLYSVFHEYTKPVLSDFFINLNSGVNFDNTYNVYFKQQLMKEDIKDVKASDTEENLHFVFPKHVEDFINEARLRYNDYLSRVSEDDSSRYARHKAPIYVLFLDEVFHLFSGEGAPIVATIWDGLANRQDKFPKNLLLVLAGNSPSVKFFNNVSSGSGKISQDSMKAFFDRLNLYFVAPDIDYASYFFPSSNMSAFLADNASDISEQDREISIKEKTSLINTIKLLNNFDYYNAVYIKRKSTKYCGVSNTNFDNNTVRYVIHYATGYKDRDTVLLNESNKINISKITNEELLKMYLYVTNTFHVNLSIYLSDDGRKGSKYLDYYIKEREAFIDRYSDLLSIIKFSYTWLLTLSNAHYMIRKYVFNYLNWIKKSEDEIEMSESLSTLSDNISKISNSVNSDTSGSIANTDVDIFYENMFYTIAAMGFVASIYSQGKCKQCVKNIADMFPSLIDLGGGDMSEALSENLVNMKALITPGSIEFGKGMYESEAINIAGVSFRLIVHGGVNVTNRNKFKEKIENEVSKFYGDNVEAKSLYLPVLYYIHAVMKQGISVDDEIVYFIPEIKGDEIDFVKAVHVVTNALANRFGYDPDQPGDSIKRVYSLIGTWLKKSQRSFTSDLTVFMNQFNVYVNNLFNLYFISKEYGSKELYDFVFSSRDSSKYFVNIPDESARIDFYNKSSEYIRSIFKDEGVSKLIFGCTGSMGKRYTYLLRTGDSIHYSGLVNLLSSKDGVYYLNHHLYLSGVEVFDFVDLYNKDRLLINKNSGDLLNLITVISFYSKMKSSDANMVFDFINAGINAIYSSGSIEFLSKSLNSYGLKPEFIKVVLTNLGCTEEQVEYTFNGMFNQVSKNDYQMIKDRLFIDLNTGLLNIAVSNEKIKKLHVSGSSYVLNRTYKHINSNPDKIVSLYNKFRKLLFEKFADMKSDGDTKFDYGCILEKLFVSTLSMYVAVYMLVYRNQQKYLEDPGLTDLIINSMSFLSEWSLISFVSYQKYLNSGLPNDKIVETYKTKINQLAAQYLGEDLVSLEVVKESLNTLGMVIEDYLLRNRDIRFVMDENGISLESFDVKVDEDMFDFKRYFVNNDLISLLYSSTINTDLKVIVTGFLSLLLLGGFYAGALIDRFMSSIKVSDLNLGMGVEIDDNIKRYVINLMKLDTLLSNFRISVESYFSTGYDLVSTSKNKKIIDYHVVKPVGGNIRIPTSLYYVKVGNIYYVKYIPTIAPMDTEEIRETLSSDDLNYIYRDRPGSIEINQNTALSLDNRKRFIYPYMVTYSDMILLLQNLNYSIYMKNDIKPFTVFHLIDMLFYTFKTTNLDVIETRLNQLLEMKETDAMNALMELIVSSGHPHMFITTYAFLSDNQFAVQLREKVVKDPSMGYRLFSDYSGESVEVEERVESDRELDQKMFSITYDKSRKTDQLVLCNPLEFSIEFSENR